MSFFAVFDSSECKRLLRGRQILIVGDSVKRTMYKDIVCLYQSNDFLSLQRIQTKMELSHMGDEAIRCQKPPKGMPKREQMDLLVETRVFDDEENEAKIYYLCIGASFGKETQDKINDLEECIDRPFDIILVHSAIWDLHIYDLENYKDCVEQLLNRLEAMMDSSGRLFWMTSPPVLLEKLDDMYNSANRKSLAVKMCNDLIASEIISSKQHGIIDLSYWLEYLLFMQIEDHIHWNRRAHRLITNVILTSICRHYREQLPNRLVFEDDTNLLPQTHYKLPFKGFREYYHKNSFADLWRLTNVPVCPKFPPMKFISENKQEYLERSDTWVSQFGIDSVAKRTIEWRKNELKSLGIEEEHCRRSKFDEEGREMEMKVIFYGNIHCPSIENKYRPTEFKGLEQPNTMEKHRSIPAPRLMSNPYIDMLIPPLNKLLTDSKKDFSKTMTKPTECSSNFTSSITKKSKSDAIEPLERINLLNNLVTILMDHTENIRTIKARESQ